MATSSEELPPFSLELLKWSSLLLAPGSAAAVMTPTSGRVEVWIRVPREETVGPIVFSDFKLWIEDGVSRLMRQADTLKTQRDMARDRFEHEQAVIEELRTRLVQITEIATNHGGIQ